MGIVDIMPFRFKRPLRRLKDSFIAITYYGKDRYCPICNKYSRKFGKYAHRDGARCMHCSTLERHRLVWVYFRKETDLFVGKPIKMLHIAPEPAFQKLLKRNLGTGYLTADLCDPYAMVKMDITNIQYPDESFDVIYCSHVLEYIPDDKGAMRELFRVLKPDGWAVLLVPITADRTFEDPLTYNPYKHLKIYNPKDHVRRYGPDYVDRLKECGFKVKIIYPSDFLSKEEITLMDITPAAGEIYYCTKK